MAETQDQDIEYYPTVSGVIVHENKTLLVLSDKLGLWLAPNTHIAVNETPIDALFRQVKEDTAITREQVRVMLPYADNLSLERDESEGITQPMPFDLDIHKVGSNGHYHVDSAYILISNTIETENKAQQVRWFDADELDELVITTKVTVSRAKYAIQKAKENTAE